MSPSIDYVVVNDQLGRSLEVARYPITIGQFRSFIEGGGYDTKSYWNAQAWEWIRSKGIFEPSYWNQPGYCENEMFPITGISFWEAEAFARFSSARLPSEAEWFWFASNGGIDQYPWGQSDFSSIKGQMTFFGFFEPGRISRVNAHPKGGSKFGIYDLVGNVAEWCYPSGNHNLSFHSGMAVLRGGASWHTPVNLDNRFRDVVNAATRDNQTGIRLVRGGPLKIRQIDFHRKSPRGIATGLETPTKNISIPRPTSAFRQEGLPTSKGIRQWELMVCGQVKKARKFSSTEQLRQQFVIHDEVGFLACVCKWAAWTKVKGIMLEDVLESAGLPNNRHELFLNFASLPGPTGKRYETSIALNDAFADKMMLIFEMDGEPLSPDFGAPLRTLDFHTYGYKHVKAVARINVSRVPRPGWWEKQKEYDFRGIIQPGSYTLVGNPALRLAVGMEGRINPSEEILRKLRTRGFSADHT